MNGPCPHCGKNFDGRHDFVQCRVDQQFLSLGVAKELPKAHKALPRHDVVVVSAAADNKVADLEQAMQLLLVAPEGTDADVAYSHLGKTREALYKHIADLERQLNVKRTVTKRF